MKKTIALIQMKVEIKNPEANYKNAIELMEKALILDTVKPDILVLPETINTGFAPSDSLRDFADVNGEKTKALFSAFAKKHSVNIVAGSVSTLRDNKLFNTTYVFDRLGNVISDYDKIHTFSPGHEDDFYESGDHLNIFEIDGIKCGSMICYDLRFPELARSLMLAGAEIIFVPAEWPTIRKYPWQMLNIARAIENQLFVCAVNGSGLLDPNNPAKGSNGGHSMLLSPLGEEILHLGEETQEIAIATIDFNDLADVRSKMSNLNDRKPAIYKL